MGLFQWGSRTNQTVNAWAAKVDGPTGIAARDAASVVSLSIKILRWPTLLMLILVVPLVAATGVIALLNDGLIATIATAIFVIELLWTGAFAWRRQQILWAIDDTDSLASQIAVAAEMSGRPQEITGELTSLNRATGQKMWSKLRGLWSKTSNDAVWIRRVQDLDRAKWFFPPSIGRTIMLSMGMLWLVPISAFTTFVLFVAAIAN